MRPDEVREAAAQHIRVAVARGRSSCAEIVADTVDFLAGDAEPDDLRALAWTLVSSQFAAHLEAQATWPARTDNDRLTDAFRALDSAGIVAREDFSCCQNCGATEIQDQVIDGEPAHGYVFYHGQDAERAAGGGSIWLAYGRLGEVPAAEVGQQVVAALRSTGLDANWDGSVGSRIQVRFNWARRRYGWLAAVATNDPAEPAVTVEVTEGRYRIQPGLTATAFARLELPFLPSGVSVRVTDRERSVGLHRVHNRLVCDDGRTVGRFAGDRLLRGEPGGEAPTEPGLLDVAYRSLVDGPGADRPMGLPEALDVVRRMPTRTGSWLSAVGRSKGIVQLRWESARLWLETPHPDSGTTTGKYATAAEAEWALTVLANEDRVAVGELDGATTQPW